jgi:hypothetical protein
MGRLSPQQNALDVLAKEKRRRVGQPYVPDGDAVGARRSQIMEQMTWPKCRKCGEGDLVPLSDYGTEGASVMYKAWVCTNPSCGFNLKIHKGNLYINEPVNERPAYSHS